MSFRLKASESNRNVPALRGLTTGKRKKSLHGNVRLQNKRLRNQNATPECIKIIVRVRPITDKEISAQDGNALVVCENKSQVSVSEKHFAFDQVFDQQSSQEQLFEAVGKPIVDACLNGAHGSIFAYGQTGSGKTYTMLGNESFDTRGVIPRVLEYLFDQIASKQKSGEIVGCAVACSFLEIYKENVSDLLLDVPDVFSMEVPSGKRSLQIRQDNAKRVYVENLTETNVCTVAQAQELLHLGGSRKKVSKTNMNDSSSRSHTVFTLAVSCSVLVEGVPQKQTSRLNLVDLAGSESQRTAGTAGERLKEGSKINQSLSALGNVIMALARTNQKGTKRRATGSTPKSSKPFVPYRDSKLTWLLKDSLGGSAKTCLIANVSPALSCVSETLSTLNFALRAKDVENKVVLNKEINEAGLSPELQAYLADIRARHQEEIANLQEQLEEARQRPSNGSAQAENNPQSTCRCYGIDVIEQVSLLHQTQLQLLEARRELKQKQFSTEGTVSPSFARPFVIHPKTPPLSFASAFPFPATTASPFLASASSFLSAGHCAPSAFRTSSPTSIVFHPLSPPLPASSEPTRAQNSHSKQRLTGDGRVVTPIVLRSGKKYPCSDKASHSASPRPEENLERHLSTPKRDELTASPPLMHTSYHLRSGQSTNVSPLTRVSVSPPSHFKFDTPSPSPNKSNIPAECAVNHKNEEVQEESRSFTFGSLTGASPRPYQPRSAEKLATSSQFGIQSTPSKKAHTPFQTPLTSATRKAQIASTPQAEPVLSSTAVPLTPMRVPFASLAPSEVAPRPIQLHPANHLFDYLEEENLEPQKPRVKEPVNPKIAKEHRSKTAELPHKAESIKSLPIKKAPSYLRQARLTSTGAGLAK